MSDMPSSTDERRTPAGVQEHWCEHPGCTRWGGFGVQRGRVTAWFCYPHAATEDHARDD